MIYLELFWSFFQVGLFSIGGGYAALPFIQKYAVDTYGWLTQTQYADLLIIAEMTPGPITLNSATFVGTQVAGLLGAVIATLAVILPAIIIVSALALLYKRHKDQVVVQGILQGLRPCVVAIIAVAGIKIIGGALLGENGFTGLSSINIVAVVLFLIASVVLLKFKPNPIIVMLSCGVLGGGVYLLLDYFKIVV